MTSVTSVDQNPKSSRTSLYVGVVLIAANLRAPITSLGPVLPDVQKALRLDGTGSGVLNALPLLIFAVVSLVAPSIGRRLGLERALGYGLVAVLLGTLARSVDHAGAIWVGTTILSVGIAVGNVLLPPLVKREFPDRAATLIGLYAAAMAGAAGLATGLAVPISQLPGSSWKWSLACWSLLALISLIFWAPHMRVAAPARLTLPAVGKPSVSPWKHPIGWQVSLFFALHSLVFYSIIDWFASYATSIGLDLQTAGIYLLIYQVVAIATNLGSAPVIRRSRDQRSLGFLCGALLLVGTAGLQLAPGLSMLWLLSAGLGAGIAMVTSLSLFALRTRDHQQAAALSGMAQFIGYAGAAAGPLLMGVLHDATHGWAWPMTLLALASALVIAFATLAGRNCVIE